MSIALIISAAPENDCSYIKKTYGALGAPIVICADGGIDKANALGISVDLLIGDMDSALLAQAANVKKLPMEKDFSDTEACVLKAVELGCEEIYLTGATGGRIDHMLCNLFLLELIESKGAEGRLIDAKNIVCLAKDGVHQTPAGFKYFSLAPLDRELAGIYISGAKYPLTNATTTRGSTLTLSNEQLGDSFSIKINHGKALLIFSKD